MPIGPKGQKRTADVIGNAVKVMRIAPGDLNAALEQARKRQEQATPTATPAVSLHYRASEVRRSSRAMFALTRSSSSGGTGRPCFSSIR